MAQAEKKIGKRQRGRYEAVAAWFTERGRLQDAELQLWRELKAVTAELEVVVTEHLAEREGIVGEAAGILHRLEAVQEQLGDLAINEPW